MIPWGKPNTIQDDFRLCQQLRKQRKGIMVTQWGVKGVPLNTWSKTPSLIISIWAQTEGAKDRGSTVFGVQGSN